MHLFLLKSNSELVLQPKHSQHREEHTQLLSQLCGLENRISTTTKPSGNRAAIAAQ